jgi:hypothetical protein
VIVGKTPSRSVLFWIARREGTDMGWKKLSAMAAAVAIAPTIFVLLAPAKDEPPIVSAADSAVTFNSASGGYSISLPSGWTQIPDKELQQREMAAQGLVQPQQSSGWKWEAAFQ